MSISMRDALLKAGAVNKKQHTQAEKTATQLQQTKLGMSKSNFKEEQTSSLINLGHITKVSKFKEVAKTILLKDSSKLVLNEIKAIAHNLQGVDGSKKLIWLIMSLIDNLGKIKSEFKDSVIKHAFRKSNPTSKISKHWLK